MIPNKQKKDIVRTIIGFSAVLAVAVGLVWLGNRNDAVSEGERLKAGILTAHQVKAAFETVGGRLVDRPIEEGMTVEAGAKLLGLDSTDTDLAIESLAAQIEQTKAQIEETELGIDLALAQADTNENSLWRQIEAAEASRKSADAALVRAKKAWNRAKELQPKGAIAQSVYDSAQADWVAAREALSSAERAIDVLAVGAQPDELAKLKKTGKAEGMRLDTVVNARQAAENQRVNVKALKAAQRQLEANLKQLEVNRSRLTISAPEKGKVLEVLFEKGELISPNTPAVLLETDRLYFDIYVSEKNVGLFQEGSSVSCYSPALDRRILGKVLFAQAAPDFASLKMVRERGQADLTLFQVRIDIPRVEGLLAGMTLEAEVRP